MKAAPRSRSTQGSFSANCGCSTKLARFDAFLLAFYTIARFADLVWRGRLGMLGEPTLQSLLWWVEVGLGAILPAILLMQPQVRHSKNALFAVGGILNRLNVSVFGH